MPKSIAHPSDLSGILSRISSLTPQDGQLWGRMSAGEMICHLTDSFLYPLNERQIATRIPTPIPPRLYKWIALNTPTKWPKGIPTTPEMEQGRGGTPPLHFESDRTSLLDAVRRLAAARSDWPPHPIFQQMSTAEWHRWAWLHADHHLRQFGR